jgi:3-methylcrotonyl-CoA carboxylase alpha subunit
VFSKILIANRGEIACRVMATARRLGIATVAVYSEADRDALHVSLADEAHYIGPAPAAESYLDIDAIVGAALKSGAGAVHPGYGFLAENPGFAEAVADIGLVFIGPPAEALRAMGSKITAKAMMERAGVPVVPGYHGEAQDLKTLAREADAIGYPVLLKASAGGGGRGMRVVEASPALAEAVEGARREAKAAFGDDQLLIEKYLDRPRHVEIQVFADAHGNAVHLFERDCSIQRRHQKVIEEAPAPGLPDGLREAMAAAALLATRAIDYQGAGTVEFMVAGDDFYFLEMNTRLQVEHPVTEMIVGADLVSWQLSVAAGAPLPCTQDDIHCAGHAIEARLCAEDPGRDFLPAAGRLSRFRLPRLTAYAGAARVDTGFHEGDEISVHYDSLIAKIVVWAETRKAAVQRLCGILEEVQIAGVTTNLDFLRTVAAHPAFAAGDVDTGFIDRHREDLVPAAGRASDRVLALASLAVMVDRAGQGRDTARRSSDPYSPWHGTQGWRLNGDSRHVLTFADGADVVTVTLRYRGATYLLELPGGIVNAGAGIDGAGDLIADIDGVRVKAGVARNGNDLTIMDRGSASTLTLIDPAALADQRETPSGSLTAPMPGRIVAVEVEAGTHVHAGATLMVLEAMKMEHAVAAPMDGTVVAVHFAVGDQVDEGAELVAFEGS